jgi:hypothetical protein
MTSDLPAPDPEEIRTPDGRRSRPNYTARRVAVGSVALAVLAIGAVAALILTGDPGSDQDAGVEPRWNSIVEIDRATGEATVLDSDGEETDRLDGVGRVSEMYVRNDRIAVVGGGQVTLADLTGASDTSTVEIASGTSVVRQPSNRTFTLVVSPEVGGEIVVIDARDGTVTELGARAGQTSPLLLPETLRLDRNGSRFAVGDGRNFQTIVIDADVEVEPAFFPGVPMAVSDEVVVTSTNVGRTAELGFFDTDGDRLGLVTSDRPVAGVLDGDRFVYVTEQGGLLAVSAGNSSPTEIVQLDVGNVETVRPVLDGARFVVTGASRTVVVDLEGSVIVETDQELPVPWDTWRCLAIAGDDAMLIDLGSGEVVAELDPLPIEAVSTDGCGVHQVDEDRHVLTSPSGTHTPRGPVRSVTLAPDGSAAIIVATDRSAELVTLDDSRRLDLGTRRGILAFADL